MTKKEAIGALVGVLWTFLLFWSGGFEFVRGPGLACYMVAATIFSALGAWAARG